MKANELRQMTTEQLTAKLGELKEDFRFPMYALKCIPYLNYEA